MECPYCGKETEILGRVFMNLETYNVGRSVLANTSCCNRGVYVCHHTSFTISPYDGDKKEDEWGVAINR